MKKKPRKTEGKCYQRKLCFHFHGISYLSIHARVYYCNYAGLSYFKMIQGIPREDETHQGNIRATLASIRAVVS